MVRVHIAYIDIFLNSSMVSKEVEIHSLVRGLQIGKERKKNSMYMLEGIIACTTYACDNVKIL